MGESQHMINRRTVTKGIAWSVPAVTIAGASPAFALSAPPPPPPPSFNWGGGCATTGNGSGCAGLRKTAQVPFTVTNTTNQPLQFQVLETKSWNTNESEPNAWGTPFGIYTNSGTQNECSPQVGQLGCDGYLSVTLAAGASANLWLVDNELGNASAFWMSVKYRWIQPGPPCGLIVGQASYIATADVIGSSDNCA